jgi:hypothetical protein
MRKEGKSKAQEIRNNLKNLEASSGRLSAHYTKAQNDINETFQVSQPVPKKSYHVRKITSM